VGQGQDLRSTLIRGGAECRLSPVLSAAGSFVLPEQAHMSAVILFLGAALAVESATTLLVDSMIFDGVRRKALVCSEFLAELLSCEYCTSFWVAAPVAILCYWKSMGWLSVAMLFPLQRASNLLYWLIHMRLIVWRNQSEQCIENARSRHGSHHGVSRQPPDTAEEGSGSAGNNQEDVPRIQKEDAPQ